MNIVENRFFFFLFYLFIPHLTRLYIKVDRKLVHVDPKNFGGREQFLEEVILRQKWRQPFFFYHKIDAKYFLIKQFFLLENKYFLSKLQKTVLRGAQVN